MKNIMTKLGLSLLLLTVALMIDAPTTYAQQTQIDPPLCLAPCQVDPQTNEVDCPCDDNRSPTVPEPMTLVLLGSGLAGAAALKRRKSA